MKIELLHIADCPNTARALERVEAALAALGRDDVAVHLRLIESAADIAGTGFAGSPTITADDADLFPGGAPSGELACRIYPTPGGHAGGHAGAPTVDQVIEALKSRGLTPSQRRR